MRHWLCSWCALGLVGLGLVGCGGGYQPKEGVIVTGTVLKGGKPMEVPRQDVGFGHVEVRLVPEAGGPVSTYAEKDGKFQILGAGAGIPPGSYRLAVSLQDNGWNSDGLRGAFSDTASPIKVEIPKEKQGRTHDLGVVDLDNFPKK